MGNINMIKSSREQSIRPDDLSMQSVRPDNLSMQSVRPDDLSMRFVRPIRPSGRSLVVAPLWSPPIPDQPREKLSVRAATRAGPTVGPTVVPRAISFQTNRIS